eukprot:CAMPEP_0113639982 /NCGR_PEP_ID=MMETSP0017_2-20120614/20982_1 /TAXON_ID=2856 /ORGANISM="Cylindrotheca closterium" /LENGTH=1017 /DNA_ID=CAMNT_0000551237 /DNA_START=112 /DNA_END=3165 /DNA_ORIENTATION=- /assembly_acc=CAM_ASM_000147
MSEVQVLSPTIHQVEGRNDHATYDVKSSYGHAHRRYSDFQWLYNRIQIEVPGAFIPVIPHKRTALLGEGQFFPDFLEERRSNLQIFLTGVMNVPNISSKCPSLTVFLKDTGSGTWEAAKKQVETENPDIANVSMPSGSVEMNDATIADAKKGLGNLMAKAKTVTQTKFGNADLQESKKENGYKSIKLYFERMEHQMKEVMDAVKKSLMPPPDNAVAEIKMVPEKQSLLASLKQAASDISTCKGAFKRRKKLQVEYTTKHGQLESHKKDQAKPPQKQKFGFPKKAKDPAKVAAKQEELEKAAASLKEQFESTTELVMREACRMKHAIDARMKACLQEHASIQMKCGEPVSAAKSLPQFPTLGAEYDNIPAPAPAPTSAAAPPAPPKAAKSPKASKSPTRATAKTGRSKSPARATPVAAPKKGSSPVRGRGKSPNRATPVTATKKGSSPVRATPVTATKKTSSSAPVRATASGKQQNITLPDANTNIGDWFKSNAPMMKAQIMATTPAMVGGNTGGGGGGGMPFGAGAYGGGGGQQYPPGPPADFSHFTAPFQNLYPNADPARWRLTEMRFKGKAKYYEKGLQKKYDGPIPEAIEQFKASPQRFVAIMYQFDMLDWDPSQHKYTLLYRKDTIDWKPLGPVPDGNLMCLTHTYERCRPLQTFPMELRDKYTDRMTYHGRPIHGRSNQPVMPGRGMGCVDLPNLKLMDKVKPGDIQQGSVGDCWLLSGISAVAEFEGAIERLFRKTPNPQNLPTDEPNVYTVTLWDLRTWSEVDIIIDERLCANPDGKKMLLGARPSKDGQLWVPYLEKAIAALCGGYDKIEGGQCTHAWPILTGVKEQYTIQTKTSPDKFGCYARFNSYRNEWADHANSPQEGERTIWRTKWPMGDDSDADISTSELFYKMSTWSAANYLMGAGTKGDSDSNTTNGLVDDHAYSVVTCLHHVAGTKVNMVQVRNPWGKGEIEDGEFADDGPGWQNYPEIKDFLKPTVSDDGLFWLTEREFFRFFERVFLCAADMKKFCQQ